MRALIRSFRRFRGLFHVHRHHSPRVKPLPFAGNLTDPKLTQRLLQALEAQGARLGGTDQARASFRAERVGYYRDYLDALVEAGKPQDAFHILERSRARGLLEMLAERDLIFEADLPSELERERRMTNVAYERTQARLGQLSPVSGNQVEGLLEELHRIREKQQEIRAEIKRQSPELEALQYPEPLGLDAARAALDEDTLLLAYSLGEKSSHLFIVTARGQGVRVVDLARSGVELRQNVTFLRRLVEASEEAPSEAQARGLAERCTRLYETLVAPAQAK